MLEEKIWNEVLDLLKNFEVEAKNFSILRFGFLLPTRLCRAATTKLRQIERSSFFNTEPQQANSNLQTDLGFIRSYFAEKHDSDGG